MKAEIAFLFAVSIGIAIPMMIGAVRGDRAQREKLLVRAQSQFEGLEVQSDDPRFRFFGLTADIVEEDVRFHLTGGVASGLTLTRFCRNDEGEYFLFISNDNRSPFLKHVPHHLARIRLKGRYAAPAA